MSETPKWTDLFGMAPEFNAEQFGVERAELVDPFATHEPDLTPDEWVDIRDEIWESPWDDPARFPDCLVEAVKVLGDLGLNGDPFSRRAATQCLRSMAYRAKTGVPFNEPQEPAWSLDSERGLHR